MRQLTKPSKVLIGAAVLPILLALVALFTPWPLAHYSRRHRCFSPLYNMAPAAPGCADLRADGLMFGFAMLVLSIGLALLAVRLSRHSR